MKNVYLAVLVVVLGAVSGGLVAHYSAKPVAPSVGSVASPDILSPYYRVGGERTWKQRTDALTQATTTVCAIQAPAATSTLQFASIRLDTSSTTASTVTLAKATTAYATTTVLGNTVLVAANAQATIVATSTTANTAAQDFVFAPNTYLVVGMAGGTGTFSPSGSCVAVWNEN